MDVPQHTTVRGPVRPGHLCRDGRGAASLEFALSAAALIAFLLGVVEVGRLAFAQHSLEMSLRQAGRYAIVRSDASDNPIDAAGVEAIVRQAAGVLDESALAVTVSYPSGNSVGNFLTIDAVYQFDFVGPFIPLATVNLEARFNGTIVN